MNKTQKKKIQLEKLGNEKRRICMPPRKITSLIFMLIILHNPQNSNKNQAKSGLMKKKKTINKSRKKSQNFVFKNREGKKYMNVFR